MNSFLHLGPLAHKGSGRITVRNSPSWLGASSGAGHLVWSKTPCLRYRGVASPAPWLLLPHLHQPSPLSLWFERESKIQRNSNKDCADVEGSWAFGYRSESCEGEIPNELARLAFKVYRGEDLARRLWHTHNPNREEQRKERAEKRTGREGVKKDLQEYGIGNISIKTNVIQAHCIARQSPLTITYLL